MKNTLLATTAVIALTTGATVRPTIGVHGAAAVAYPSKTPGPLLYNQNSGGDGYAILSQNFTSGTYSTLYNAAGADDFVIGSAATMTGVDVTGVFFNGSGPAKGATAQLFTGKNAPNRLIATGASTGLGPNFVVKVRHKIRSGERYWVSVAANCSFTGGCGEWAGSGRAALRGSLWVTAGAPRTPTSCSTSGENSNDKTIGRTFCSRDHRPMPAGASDLAALTRVASPIAQPCVRTAERHA